MGGQPGGVGRRENRPGESGARCGGSPCLGQGGDVSVLELLGLDGGQVVGVLAGGRC